LVGRVCEGWVNIHGLCGKPLKQNWKNKKWTVVLICTCDPLTFTTLAADIIQYLSNVVKRSLDRNFGAHTCHVDTICSIEHENTNTQSSNRLILLYFFYRIYIDRCLDYTCIAAVSIGYMRCSNKIRTRTRSDTFLCCI